MLRTIFCRFVGYDALGVPFDGGSKPPPYVADFVFAREGRPLPYEIEISFCILNFEFCIVL